MIQKWLSESRTFIKICFFYKSISLQNLMRCKTFFSETWHVLKFSIRNLSSCEKTALIWRIWNSWFKIWRVVQQMIQKLIIFKNFDPKIQTIFLKKKNNSLRNNFSKNAQKSQLCCFYCVNWPDKWFLESEFSDKFWFSRNSLFHWNLMRC